MTIASAGGEIRGHGLLIVVGVEEVELDEEAEVAEEPEAEEEVEEEVVVVVEDGLSGVVIGMDDVLVSTEVDDGTVVEAAVLTQEQALNILVLALEHAATKVGSGAVSPASVYAEQKALASLDALIIARCDLSVGNQFIQ